MFTGENRDVQPSFNGQAIRVASVLGFNPPDLEHITKDVTGFEWVEAQDDTLTPTVRYEPSDMTSVAFDKSTTTLHVEGPQSQFETGRSILYMAEYLATSIQSVRDGIFLTHAAATYDPSLDASYLILGEKGAGKTTLSIRMCRDLGHLLIGNDQVYFGGTSSQPHTYQGNRWFNVRNTAIDGDKALAKLVAKLPENPANSAWNTKQRIEPEQIGVGTHTESSLIRDILHIRIDPTQEHVYARPWESVQRNLIIHEKLGRHVLGQATPFQDDKGVYFGSLPLIYPRKALRQRDDLTKMIIQKGITELFVPDADAALEFLEARRN